MYEYDMHVIWIIYYGYGQTTMPMTQIERGIN